MTEQEARNQKIIDNIASGIAVELKIELTGKQVRALRRVKDERLACTDTNYELGNLLMELEDRYENHIANNPITVPID